MVEAIAIKGREVEKSASTKTKNVAF
jgi:hypothetical protein